MIVCYRDDLGYTGAKVDGEISFLDGYAFFSVDGKDYKVELSNLICIENKEE